MKTKTGEHERVVSWVVVSSDIFLFCSIFLVCAAYRQFLCDSLLGHYVASRSRCLYGKRVEYPVAATGVPPAPRNLGVRRRVRGGVRAIHESDAPPPHVGTPRRRVVERAQRVYRLAHRGNRVVLRTSMRP